MTITFEELESRLKDNTDIAWMGEMYGCVRLNGWKGIDLDRTDIINLAKYFGITAEELEDDNP